MDQERSADMVKFLMLLSLVVFSLKTSIDRANMLHASTENTSLNAFETLMKKMDMMENLMKKMDMMENLMKKMDAMEKRFAEIGNKDEDPPKQFDPLSRFSGSRDTKPSTSASEGRTWGLRFRCSGLGSRVYHNTALEDQGASVAVELQDLHSCSIVEHHPNITVQINALRDSQMSVNSTAEQYDVAQPRNFRTSSLLSGNCDVGMKNGLAVFRGIKFTDISNGMMLRFGAQVVGNPILAGKIKRGASNQAFVVRHDRGLKDKRRRKQASVLAANGTSPTSNMINSGTNLPEGKFDQQQGGSPTFIARQGSSPAFIVHPGATLHRSSEQPLQENEVDCYLDVGSLTNHDEPCFNDEQGGAQEQDESLLGLGFDESDDFWLFNFRAQTQNSTFNSNTEDFLRDRSGNDDIQPQDSDGHVYEDDGLQSQEPKKPKIDNTKF